MLAGSRSPKTWILAPLTYRNSPSCLTSPEKRIVSDSVRDSVAPHIIRLMDLRSWNASDFGSAYTIRVLYISVISISIKNQNPELSII